jgi:hypothetical protein
MQNNHRGNSIAPQTEVYSALVLMIAQFGVKITQFQIIGSGIRILPDEM